jgi:HEAT repeat protein
LAGIDGAVVTEIRAIFDRFRSGAEEEAFFELLEMPGDVVPALTTAFRTEQNPALRTFVIKVAWQRGDRQAIALLAEAINQSDEQIWQEALDGLVALASPEAVSVLTVAKTRELADESATHRFQSCVTEALEYIRQIIPR